jgi:hypothetical protein
MLLLQQLLLLRGGRRGYDRHIAVVWSQRRERWVACNALR